jgi:hypothetical protein
MKVMVIVKGTAESEAGQMPSTELLEAMGKYNEELVAAGLMLAGDGLHPTSKGARVTLWGKDRTVKTGPFKLDNTVSGYWLWKVGSMDEAIDWAKRCPSSNVGPGELEIRPVFEAEDFGAEFTPELREQEERLRQKVSKAS